MIKNCYLIILTILISLNAKSQSYNSAIPNDTFNKLMIVEIDSTNKANDDNKIGKKRVYSKPISWSKAIIHLFTKDDINTFDYQLEKLTNRDKQYNLELKPLTELFNEQDLSFMKKQFESENSSEWNFKTHKGKIKQKVKRKYYCYSLPLFSKNLDKAIIYREFRGCGNLCGEADVIVYIKIDGNWKKYKTIPLWIS